MDAFQNFSAVLQPSRVIPDPGIENVVQTVFSEKLVGQNSNLFGKRVAAFLPKRSKAFDAVGFVLHSTHMAIELCFVDAKVTYHFVRYLLFFENKSDDGFSEILRDVFGFGCLITRRIF